MSVDLMSVILSGVWRARSVRQTQSKDPYNLDAAETVQPFLPVWRPHAALAILAIFSQLSAASEAQQRRIPARPKADHVLVLKRQHILQLLHGGRVMKEYKVALGGSPPARAPIRTSPALITFSAVFCWHNRAIKTKPSTSSR
jgi:hypothetical protein